MALGLYGVRMSFFYVLSASGALLCLFEGKGLSGLVAHLCGSPVLDGARINICGLTCPFVALSSKALERSTIQFNESLTDNWLHLTITLLHVHHHRDGHTTGNPLVCRSSRILYNSHVTCLAIGNQLGC